VNSGEALDAGEQEEEGGGEGRGKADPATALLILLPNKVAVP